ncbi:hypothetical protein [Brevibacillus dissolubilis]|uniref:hypothetical protein n=1 Tax=Brevibacillus dissolubilis TaxID=1844116 RepID=UPI001116ECEF|nr:hypothetical protein [Brevibacillus dissolubilis]
MHNVVSADPFTRFLQGIHFKGSLFPFSIPIPLPHMTRVTAESRETTDSWLPSTLYMYMQRVISRPETTDIAILDTVDAVNTDKRKTIHQQFEEQVTRTPDKPALSGEGNTITYRELNARANLGNEAYQTEMDNLLLHGNPFSTSRPTMIEVANDKTLCLLERCGFQWSAVTKEQIGMMLGHGREAGFFGSTVES